MYNQTACTPQVDAMFASMSQVESGIAMQNLKPTIDNIKRLYGDDKKKIQRETSELYKKAKVQPLAGTSPNRNRFLHEPSILSANAA